MLVDTHCHIFSEYYSDIDTVIKNAKDNGINMIIVNGIDRKTNEEVLKLVSKYDIVYGALGFQPEVIESVTDDDLKFLEEHINDDKIIAIGEIGLDYHYDIDRVKQKLRSAKVPKRYFSSFKIHTFIIRSRLLYHKRNSFSILKEAIIIQPKLCALSSKNYFFIILIKII